MTGETTETDTAEAVDASGKSEDGAATDAVPATPTEAEIEVFYTFTWGGKRGRQAERGRGKPRGEQGQTERGKGKRSQGGDGAKADGRPRKGKPKGQRPQGGKAQTFSAKPARKEKPIDPDNPFAAALMGLKDGK